MAFDLADSDAVAPTSKIFASTFLLPQARTMMPPPAVRELWEMLDLVEEILIRIPPDEPACLISASLACKPWCRRLSSHAFRVRYRTLHKTPPLLGFLQYDDLRPFVPTANFRPRNPERRDKAVLDCRHGRVLLMCELKVGEKHKGCLDMVVWDPVSGSRAELPLPDPDFFPPHCSAVVLCAADGCNHISCNMGPFLVVFIDLDYSVYRDTEDDEAKRLLSASVYSSHTREWTERDSIGISDGYDGCPCLVKRPGVTVGQELYFLLVNGDRDLGILKYDLDKDCLSVIDLPAEMRECIGSYNPLLISANDGGLGLVHIDKKRVCTVWSMEVSLDGVVSCIKLKEMDLKMLLPMGNPTAFFRPKVPLGYVEGADIILVTTNLGVFTIDIKSLVSRKLSSKPRLETQEHVEGTYNLFPYMCFNNPPAVAGVVSEARASRACGDAEV